MWIQLAALELTIEVRRQNGFAVAFLKGEVNVFTAPKLRNKLIGLIDSGARDMVVDMDGLGFCDSTGLGVLIGTLKTVKSYRGALLLVCTRENILKLFKTTGLNAVFSIHTSASAAIAAERARRAMPQRVSGER